VIGGGISGLFIAYELAKRGVKDVVVLEKRYVGAGSTGRCATGIRASFTSEEHIVLMRESIRMWKEYSEGELGRYGLRFTQSGYVWIARKEESAKLFRKLIELHNSFGVPTRLIDLDELKTLVPPINKDIVVAAMLDPTAGKSYVFSTLLALVRACRSLGVEIKTGVEVRKLVAERNRVVEAVTDSGVVKADVFVVAAGAESRDLLRTVGVELPVKNMPRHVLVTEAYRRTFDPLVIDWDTPGVPYIVQTDEGSFFIGRDIEEQAEASLLLQRIDFMPKALKPIVELFPFLKHVRVLRYWLGYYITTPDHHPVYGPCEEYENLYVATGFSGHGYMMGPITGRIIAEWIIDGKPSIPQAERLKLDRFRKGQLVREFAVVG